MCLPIEDSECLFHYFLVYKSQLFCIQSLFTCSKPQQKGSLSMAYYPFLKTCIIQFSCWVCYVQSCKLDTRYIVKVHIVGSNFILNIVNNLFTWDCFNVYGKYCHFAVKVIFSFNITTTEQWTCTWSVYSKSLLHGSTWCTCTLLSCPLWVHTTNGQSLYHALKFFCKTNIWGPYIWGIV